MGKTALRRGICDSSYHVLGEIVCTQLREVGEVTIHEGV